MKPLQEFVIPLKGMKSGLHYHSFEIDGTFFEHFEDSMVDECDVKVDVEIDKRPNMVIFQFRITGTVLTDCDRCLAEIDLPITGSYPLIAKFGEMEGVPDSDTEIITIHPDTPQFNVAGYIYDFISLSIPMKRSFDCESLNPKPCDMETKKHLETQADEGKGENPIWDELRKKLG